jgi:hypothetical protein
MYGIHLLCWQDLVRPNQRHNHSASPKKNPTLCPQIHQFVKKIATNQAGAGKLGLAVPTYAGAGPPGIPAKLLKQFISLQEIGALPTAETCNSPAMPLDSRQALFFFLGGVTQNKTLILTLIFSAELGY